MEKQVNLRFRGTLALVGIAAFALHASLALAQTTPPEDAKGVPLPPPLPPIEVNDPALEPQVTIVKKESETVEEYRIHGHLYMMKVTPAHGVPYVLIDNRGDGVFSRQQSLDNGLRVPQWVLYQF